MYLLIGNNVSIDRKKRDKEREKKKENLVVVAARTTKLE